MKTKAVILAAGLGNRISAVAKDTPKPLLPLNGKPSGDCFLDWHLECLSRAGVSEIYLVGNQKTFGTKLRAMSTINATWILNPTEEISTSGSGHSAWFAWNSPHGILDSDSRVLLMDADILYSPSLIGHLLEQTDPRSKTLICEEYRDTDEEVLVFSGPGEGEKDNPRIHGKGLLRTPLVEGAQCLGEATGILLFEPKDHEALRVVSNWVIKYSTAKTRSEHEDITQRMMGMGRMMAVKFARTFEFMECDTPDEYEVLVNEMYPKVSSLLVPR